MGEGRATKACDQGGPPRACGKFSSWCRRPSRPCDRHHSLPPRTPQSPTNRQTHAFRWLYFFAALPFLWWTVAFIVGRIYVRIELAYFQELVSVKFTVVMKFWGKFNRPS
jgi:hypothetical protein